MAKPMTKLAAAKVSIRPRFRASAPKPMAAISAGKTTDNARRAITKGLLCASRIIDDTCVMVRCASSALQHSHDCIASILISINPAVPGLVGIKARGEQII
ncbi:hypothetical protein BLN97_03655 [Bradyrhizobium elkanii]|jgi:hypothetical protein|nr:hypothetical protein BLN97_03655 [Bradyrhizobium elkanii]